MATARRQAARASRSTGAASPTRSGCPAARRPISTRISLLVVFLCLAALYESWSIPFSVLLVDPARAWSARASPSTLRGLNNDVYFQVGLLTTMGLAAKNAILIVEFAERAEKRGAARDRRGDRGGAARLRPILMTSLAFIAGVLPLAISTGAGANSRIAIGTAVIGGMLTATILAIFFMPLFFVLVRRLFRRRRGRPHERRKRRAEVPAHDEQARLSRSARGLRSPAAASSRITRGPSRRCRRPGRSATPICARARRRCRAVTYQDVFRDPRLQALIDQALANNRDLRIAAANIASARAHYRVQRADLFPQVDAAAPAARSANGRVAANGDEHASFTADVGITAFRARPVRPRPLAQPRRARPLFRDRGRGARDPADAGRRDRHRLFHLAADRSLLAIAAETAANAAARVAADRRAAAGRGRAAHRPAPGADHPRHGAESTSPARRRAVAQDGNALQLLVGAPVAMPTCSRPRSRRRRAGRRSSRRARFRHPAAPPGRRRSRISIARRQCPDRRGTRRLLPAHQPHRPARPRQRLADQPLLRRRVQLVGRRQRLGADLRLRRQ